MNYNMLIDSYYPSLSKSEKKVANLIKKQGEKFIYQSIQEVAQDAKVGEATVLRFCRTIGFEGFRDMKLHIAKENTPIRAKRKDNYVEEIVRNFEDSIQETYSAIVQENLEKVASLIKKSDRVFLFGIGASANAVFDMCSRLLRYGKTVYTVTDSHYQMMNSAILDEKDLVIAFSISGVTEDIIDSIELAKKNNASLVVITNHILSPLASLGDICLLTAGKESPIDGGSLTGRVSQMLVTDLLCTTYALIDEDMSELMREKTANSVLRKSVEYKKKKK